MPESVSTPWRTVKDAAARAKTSTETIYREVKAGRLKAVRIGGKRSLRFRDEWVDQWLEASLSPHDLVILSRRA